MPIGSQVLCWPAAGFDQSSLKALLQLFLSDFAFSVGQAFFIFSFYQPLEHRSRKKKHITKLSNQSLMAFLVVLHSLAHTQHQFEVTRIPLQQDQQECFYIVQLLLIIHPSFPENEGIKHLSKFEFFISLVLASLLVTETGLGEQPVWLSDWRTPICCCHVLC